jgi:hypothetical protein
MVNFWPYFSLCLTSPSNDCSCISRLRLSCCLSLAEQRGSSNPGKRSVCGHARCIWKQRDEGSLHQRNWACWVPYSRFLTRLNEKDQAAPFFCLIYHVVGLNINLVGTTGRCRAFGAQTSSYLHTTCRPESRLGLRSPHVSEIWIRLLLCQRAGICFQLQFCF